MFTWRYIAVICNAAICAPMPTANTLHERLTEHVPDDQPMEVITQRVRKIAALLQMRKQHPLLGECPGLATHLLQLNLVVAEASPNLLSAIVRDFVMPTRIAAGELPASLAAQLARAWPHLKPAVQEQIRSHVAVTHAPCAPFLSLCTCKMVLQDVTALAVTSDCGFAMQRLTAIHRGVSQLQKPIAWLHGSTDITC